MTPRSASVEVRMVSQVLALLAVERRLGHQLRHADDAVHRRADLVAHRGEEDALQARFALGAVARLGQLGGPRHRPAARGWRASRAGDRRPAARCRRASPQRVGVTDDRRRPGSSSAARGDEPERATDDARPGRGVKTASCGMSTTARQPCGVRTTAASLVVAVRRLVPERRAVDRARRWRSAGRRRRRRSGDARRASPSGVARRRPTKPDGSRISTRVASAWTSRAKASNADRRSTPATTPAGCPAWRNRHGEHQSWSLVADPRTRPLGRPAGPHRLTEVIALGDALPLSGDRAGRGAGDRGHRRPHRRRTGRRTPQVGGVAFEPGRELRRLRLSGDWTRRRVASVSAARITRVCCSRCPSTRACRPATDRIRMRRRRPGPAT